jgi:ATP-dependent protease ClpP protease subunit
MDIHSQETKHNSRKSSISHKISQYSTGATNRIQDKINRIQDTKHRKTTEYREKTKHENKEKATTGN